MADAIADRLPAPGEHDRTLVGNFITGAFATLLATPCSAPFVGTAIGFALAGSTFDLFATAFFMSLGMAAPFLLMAAKPELGRFLPRPGRWMAGLKAVLGLALMGTVFWLSTMLHRQLSTENAAMMTALPLIILVVLWIAASIRRPIRFVQGLGVMVLILMGSWFFHLPFIQNALNRSDAAQETAALAWQPFEENKISDLVARGKIVMVDITADWCLTCAANEKFVLSSQAGQTLLSDKNVVLMRGDWTTPSPEITAYLRRHGRYGIPFNIVYSPKNPHGVVLPELLTLDALAMALNPMNCLDSKTRAC
jgi:suppressor for copper-sensitivity B